MIPDARLSNPIWHSLETRHSHLALRNGEACRYPADVAPFAAIAEPSAAAFVQVAELLTSGESLYLVARKLLPMPHLQETSEVLQMVLPADFTPPEPALASEPLSAADAPDMAALTGLAFPGFYRPRTYLMGSYYGARAGGELIAMGGERMLFDGYNEISGVCTHPGHRSKGYAAALIWRLVQEHRRQGVTSWLHVTAENQRAIDLYLWMGFVKVSSITLHRLLLP